MVDLQSKTIKMALTERHRWCMGKVLETFGSELEKEALEAFMRQEAVLQKFSSFFRGETSGRLFVFYQPETLEGEVRSIYISLSNVIFLLESSLTFFSPTRYFPCRHGPTKSALSSCPFLMVTTV